MTAPPPMPNRPASNPVMTPPTMMAKASQSSSLNGTPKIILCRLPGRDGSKLRGDVRQFPVRVQGLVRNKRERRGKEFGAGLRGSRGAGEMPAVSARAGHRVEQAVQMSRDGVQPRAACDFTFDIRGERSGGLFRRAERSVLAEHQRIDRDQPPRLLIGGAAHHDAIDPGKMRNRLLDAANAAIENDGEPRMCALEPIDAIVIERRHL